MTLKKTVLCRLNTNLRNEITSTTETTKFWVLLFIIASSFFVVLGHEIYHDNFTLYCSISVECKFLPHFVPEFLKKNYCNTSYKTKKETLYPKTEKSRILHIIGLCKNVTTQYRLDV